MSNSSEILLVNYNFICDHTILFWVESQTSSDQVRFYNTALSVLLGLVQYLLCYPHAVYKSFEMIVV